MRIRHQLVPTYPAVRYSPRPSARTSSFISSYERDFLNMAGFHAHSIQEGRKTFIPLGTYGSAPGYK